MAEVSVQIIDNSDLIEQATNEAIVKALEAMGLQAEGYAKMKCPVDTGLLRNSITHAVGGQATAIQSYSDIKNTQSGSYSGAAPDGAAVYIGTNVEYAPYVEYGTQKTKAQPFLEPAVTDHVDEYKRIAENFLKNG